MYNENAIETQSITPERRGKYFAGIIVCIVLLYVFNNLLSLYLLSVPEGSNLLKAIMDSAYTQWKIPFLADNFISCLWAINLALVLGMMGNFWFLFYRPRWFYFFLQAVMIAVGIIPVYFVRQIFPFIINSQSAQTLIKTGLFALMIILGAISLFLFIKASIAFVRTIRNFDSL